MEGKMAVLNGKLYFSWVQRSRLCIPDPSSIQQSALSIQPLNRLGLIRVYLRASAVRAFSVLLFSAPPRLRGELFFQNGGLR
jgi:hypothetical protein